MAIPYIWYARKGYIAIMAEHYVSNYGWKKRKAIKHAKANWAE